MRRHTTKLRNVTRILIALLSLQWAGVSTAFAAETSLGPLVTLKVFIKQSVDDLKLEQSKSVSAFTPTKVNCPKNSPRGCTILVETSLDLWGGPANGAMWETLLVSGLINDVIVLDATPTCCLHSQKTFQFLVPNVQAGSTVKLDLQLMNLFDTAYVNHRVETIKLQLK